MSKYTFKDLKARPKNVELPEDCNEVALQIAERFKDEELKKDIREVQKNRWFGTLYHRDEHGNIKAYFEFCSGICIKQRLVKNMGKSNEFHMNVQNTKLIFKKGDDHGMRQGNEEGQRLEG